MQPLQPGRRSRSQSQEELFETVKPFGQRGRLDEEDRFVQPQIDSFSSSTYNNQSSNNIESRFRPTYSPTGSMPRHIPAYVEPSQNYFDERSNELHRPIFNDLSHDHEIYPSEPEQPIASRVSYRNPANFDSFSNNSDTVISRQTIDPQNFFQQPQFIKGFNQPSHDQIQHHPSSMMHPYAPQSYQSVDSYPFDATYYPEYNMEDFRIDSSTNRIQGANDHQPPQIRSEEASIDNILRSKGSVKQAAVSSTNGKIFSKKVKKEFQAPLMTEVCTIIDSDDKNNDKTPVPQNLRGDPFRSAKVKTELCRHFGTAKGCPFGDKCNYAHGEHELKYTKLMDLERAGLIDIEIYRTHPCPAWVATGSCPFDSRCSGLHDPRIRGNSSSWLPHAETMMNRIGESTINIDKLYHQRLSEVYSCSPIYGYIPLKRWSFQRHESQVAWSNYYSFICNINQPIYTRTPQATTAETVLENSLEPVDKWFDDSDIFRLMIILEMRKNRLGQSFVYMPTHIICGELCMLIQTRRFDVFQKKNPDSSYSWHVNEISTKEKSDITTVGKQQSTQIVNAYEIAFGPVGDPSARPLSIWFDIPSSNLTPCTQKEAKNHKRSRHRLKKNRKKEKVQTIGKNQNSNDKQHALDDSDDLSLDSLSVESFNHYQPLDQATFDHTTAILEHRLSVLQLHNSNSTDSVKDKQTFKKLVKNHNGLKHKFESLRRHWMSWSWPINFMEDEIHDETDVIPVDSVYQFVLNDEDNFRTTAFHGAIDAPGLNESFRHRSKLVLLMIWSSFLTNINPSASHKVMKDIEELRDMFKFSRLSIFEHLSSGKKISRNRNCAVLNQFKQNNQGDRSTVLQICEQWENVKGHIHEKNQGSRASHPSDTQERRRATTPSIVSEASLENDISSQRDEVN